MSALSYNTFTYCYKNLLRYWHRKEETADLSAKKQHSDPKCKFRISTNVEWNFDLSSYFSQLCRASLGLNLLLNKWALEVNLSSMMKDSFLLIQKTWLVLTQNHSLYVYRFSVLKVWFTSYDCKLESSY